MRQQCSGKSSLPRRRAPVKHRNAKALANPEPHEFIRGSGQKKENLEEPFIWEPEDWTSEEWAVLCKVCDLPPVQTERIVLHASVLESYVDADKTVEDCENDRTYIVTEMCPHCQSEVQMQWDTDTMGFKAFCPVCGERLMLCDECLQVGGVCDYDSETDTCKHNQPVPKT